MNSKLNVFTIVNSLYCSNTYILSSSSDVDNGVWTVDLGDTDWLTDCLAENVVLRGILLTHTHYDHIYGINDALRLFPDIRIITTEFGKQALCSPKLNYSRYHLNVKDFICDKPENIEVFHDGDVIHLTEEQKIHVYSTPGHDRSCLTYVTSDYVFSGDSFIPGIKTRATFLHSEKEKVQASEDRIRYFAEHRTLFPGHGLSYVNKNWNK